MKRLKSILGYSWAALALPIAIATFAGLNFWGHQLVAKTGLKVTPWYSGGETVGTVLHPRYSATIHRPVFDGLVCEYSRGFVQIDWTPAKGEKLPERIDEEIDFDGDGKIDVRVQLEAAKLTAEATPKNEAVEGLEGVYSLHDGAVAVRIKLRNLKSEAK